MPASIDDETPDVASQQKDNVLLSVKSDDGHESHDSKDGLVNTVQNKQADVSLKLFEQYEEEAGELTPELERKLKIKIWLFIVPIVFAVNFLLFLDKNAMGYATLLGMFEDMNLNQQKYNDLQTLLYLGYLVGQIPSHVLFQKLPLSYYISGTTLLWAFLTLVQLSCKSFHQVASVRFFLGFFESGVTPCIAHTIAMWFTPEEQAIVVPIFWISCIGQGLFGGPLSYGIQFVDTVSPWKVYWSIIGGLTFLLSVTSFFVYPDNPATYKFFTPVERIHVIKRIKAATSSSIEQKTVKKEQVYEALKDPITWLFGLFVFCNMFCNNISFQSAIIYKNLGFDNLQSTLVSIASSGYSTVVSIIGSLSLVYFRGQTAHISTVYSTVALFGGILVMALPLSKPYGILAGIFLTNSNAVTFIAALSWSQSSAAGYTKRLVRTIIWSISYAVVNLFASQFWRAKDKPRYYLAWGLVVSFSWVIAPIILQIIRFILNRRNKERKQLLQDIADGKVEDTLGYVTYTDEEGHTAKRAVDISMLDLTDLQNKKFIYPL